jgi:hypothetical protein
MRRPWSRTAILAVCLAAGCTSFDHDNNGTSRRVLLGKQFTITMPASEQPTHPQIDDPRVALFLEHSVEDGTGKNVYTFKATQVGETEIHIAHTDGSPDFVMTIVVVLGGTLSP